MVGIEFDAIVQEFDPKSSIQYDALEQLTLNYPYFPTPWAYLAKAAQVQKKIEADRIIERAAILSYNRAAFKDWMDQELQQPTSQQSESIKTPSPQTKEASTQEKEVPTTKKAKKKSPQNHQKAFEWEQSLKQTHFWILRLDLQRIDEMWL